MNAELAEKIERYLNGEMQPPEGRDFELQLSADEGLRKELELYKSINTTMNAPPSEEELRRTLQQMNRKYFPGGAKLMQGAFKKWMAVAAAVTVIVFGAVYFLISGKPSTEKLYARYAEPVSLDVQLRGSSADSLAQKAAAEFNKKNYAAATPLLEQYLLQRPDDAQMKFSLGVAYTETRNHERADKLFAVMASGNSAFAETAKWWFALSALKQNDKAQCRERLGNILSTSPYYTRAKELLKELD